MQGKRFFGLIFVIAFTLYILFPAVVKTESTLNTEIEWEQIDQLSGELYTLTKNHEFAKANAVLDRLGEQLANAREKQRITLEGAEVVAQSIKNGKQAFSAMNPNEDRLLWHALQIRLAVDALTHGNQPMWKQYYSAYSAQIKQMQDYASEQTPDKLYEVFDNHYQLFKTLEPAMQVSVSLERVQMIQSVYKSIITEARKDFPNWDEMNFTIQQLQMTADEVFWGNDTSTFARYIHQNSPYLLISSIAAFVVVTLAYVAWKKYLGLSQRS